MWWLTVIPTGLAGVVAGLYALTRQHRSATLLSAALGLLTVMATLIAYGVSMATAFRAVAEAPSQVKQQLLAEAIATAQWTLPIGMGLAGTCVLLSFVSWWRLGSRTTHEE